MNVRYTPESVDDLQRLREFIAEKNPLAAQRIANELLTGIEKLKMFPRMGISVFRAPDPELIRDLFIDQYTVRYLLSESEIFILRIWHDKENERDL
jgi:plasmid stabilization system protein ParE